MTISEAAKIAAKTHTSIYRSDKYPHGSGQLFATNTREGCVFTLINPYTHQKTTVIRQWFPRLEDLVSDAWEVELPYDGDEAHREMYELIAAETKY